MGKYQELFSKSITDPKAFWADAAEAIGWHKKWDQVLDESNPPFYRWFKGGELNTCCNALDRHVEGGRADQVALIYDSPVTEHDREVHLPGAAGAGLALCRSAQVARA